MLKRSLMYMLMLVFFMAAYGGAEDLTSEDPDLEKQIDDLKKENKQLRSELDQVNEKVDEALSRTAGLEGAETLDPFTYMSLMDDPVQSGFIRKGSLTGMADKLLNVNVFLGMRFNQINNDSAAALQMEDQIDDFSIPFARLHLSGQAFDEIYYTASFEFADFNDAWLYQYPGMFGDDTLHDVTVSWRPDGMEDCPLTSFSVTAGMTQTFMSPAGSTEPWEQDFIEYPQMVYRIMSPGLNRDIGAYAYGDMVGEGRLKVWLGLWNGTHREMYFNGGMASAIDPVGQLDAWGNGRDSDKFAYMGRVQLDILDEEDYFLMGSAGWSFSNVAYEVAVGGVPVPGTRNDKLDRIYDVASEFRFLNRTTWVKGEFAHAYTADTMLPTHRGYYLAAGHRLDYISEQFEVVYRYDRVKLRDSFHSSDDVIYNTFGINFYLDPEHKHDAKLQLNYVDRKDSGLDPSNNAFLMQFVLGF